MFSPAWYSLSSPAVEVTAMLLTVRLPSAEVVGVGPPSVPPARMTAASNIASAAMRSVVLRALLRGGGGGGGGRSG